jgi:hypothetical protein
MTEMDIVTRALGAEEPIQPPPNQTEVLARVIQRNTQALDSIASALRSQREALDAVAQALSELESRVTGSGAS